jgi:hypothetical protein
MSVYEIVKIAFLVSVASLVVTIMFVYADKEDKRDDE